MLFDGKKFLPFERTSNCKPDALYTDSARVQGIKFCPVHGIGEKRRCGKISKKSKRKSNAARSIQSCIEAGWAGWVAGLAGWLGWLGGAGWLSWLGWAGWLGWLGQDVGTID